MLKVIVFVVLAFQMAWADEALIEVTGTAEKNLEATHLNLQLEVWGKSTSAKQAQASAAQQFRSLKSQVDQFKIKKEDFQSHQYQLNPEYNYRGNETPQISGYRASQSLMITIRKLEDVGPFIDAIITSKTNNMGVTIQGMTWDSDKRRAAEMALLADAVKDARMRAEELAKSAQVKIKRLYRLSDSKTTQISPMPRMSLMKSSSAEIASTEIAPGQIKVSTEVTAQYEINP